jgi:hypothetical protein
MPSVTETAAPPQVGGLTREAPEPVGPAFATTRAASGGWRLAHGLSAFRPWLEQGAPAQDASDGTFR